ncbi:MAG TPA: flagellar hook basal-body protein [Novosphingobium sp.]|nr:flagellar hook basal-body protein [Novosphingobium sp.]
MSFYTALNGISNAQTELNTISNNLANAQTTGFKSSRVNFADVVAGSAYTNPKLVDGIGSRVKTIDQNFSSGSIENTGSALDLACNGEGFFTVTSPISGDQIYTRNGNFSTDSAGYITDTNGNRLQIFAYNSTSSSYATTLSDGKLPTSITTSSGGTATYSGVQIATDGTISASYSDGTVNVVGKVALASFVAPTGLLQTGDQDWKATGLSGNATYQTAQSSGMGTILSGSLEQSNVDVSSQLVDMISAQQYYQANSKIISTNNQMVQYIMNATQG